MWRFKIWLSLPLEMHGLGVSRWRHHKWQVVIQNQQELRQCEDDSFKFVQMWTKQSRADSTPWCRIFCTCLWFYPVRNYRWLIEMMKQNSEIIIKFSSGCSMKGTSEHSCILVQCDGHHLVVLEGARCQLKQQQQHIHYYKNLPKGLQECLAKL